MKKWILFFGAFLFAWFANSCTSARYASASYAEDDLYAIHDKTTIARKQQAEAEARKAEADARRAQWKARLAEAEAAAAEQNYYSGGSSGSSYSYSSVLADSYESAYARRLRGFNSLTYRLPSSYYNFRYSSAFNYVSAYDPAFYNIVISGDEVWVEPKYITSMFGSWGGTIYTGNWYFGWDYGPARWWNYPRYGWYGWNWGLAGWHRPWYDPWDYRPGWHPAWHRPGPGWGLSYRPPHNYRTDRYQQPPVNKPNTGWRAPQNASGNRGYNSGRTGSYNNGRSGSYNNRGGSGTSSGSSNNNSGSGSYNRRGGSSSSSGSGSRNDNNSNRGSYNGGSHNSGRGDSYNSGRGTSSSSYGGSSSSRSSSGYSGGSYSSGSHSSGSSSGGGRSYNSGR